MKKITLEKLLDRIYCADEDEIHPILDAIAERFSEVWPEWELATLSIPGHTVQDHITAFQQALDLLHSQNEKNDLP